MGWTYTRQSEKSLDEQKSDHAWEATRYGSNVRAEILAQEWHAKTWFAVIRLTKPDGKVVTWLRIDLIDTAGGQFGYKDGSEDMGMYQDGKPSRGFAAEIYRHIPSAQGYGIEWRARNGVKHDNAEQGVMAV